MSHQTNPRSVAAVAQELIRRQADQFLSKAGFRRDGRPKSWRSRNDAMRRAEFTVSEVNTRLSDLLGSYLHARRLP